MFSPGIRTLGRNARLVPVLASLALGGCVIEEGVEPSGEIEDVLSAEEAIVDGTAVSNGSLLAKSTVGVWSPQGQDMWTACTGVIIGYRHVLTAAHCKPTVGGVVKFYTGPLPMSGETREVTAVNMRPGVHPATDDLHDSSGDFADIALLTLDEGIPSGTLSAELPLTYPGNNVNGYIVGRGSHASCDPAWSCIDGQPNEDEDLRYFSSHTYSSDNSDGHFLVDDPNVNKGDSGGPFYTYSASSGRERVHGVLYGTVFEWGAHAKYTSIELHLSWILETMSYTGGMIIDTNTYRSGSTYSSYIELDWRRCAVACSQDATCRSFSYVQGGLCELKSSAPAKITASGVVSGAKFTLSL